MELYYRIQLYIYTLQHYEDFPNDELFPEPFFSEKEKKEILEKIGDKIDEVVKNKMIQKKHICTAHDIAPIIICEFEIKKSKITKKDVNKFIKKFKK